MVGHSSGAHLGVSVLARLERAGVVTPKSPISFLSLGHVVPMVSFLPAATELRSDLKQLGNSDAVTWVDVTAPVDGCSFALCDPVAVSGQGDGRQNGPLVLSAAFTQTLSDARWRALRWRFSVFISNICAPLTDLGFMITFRSRQGHIHCVIAFRDGAHHRRASWRRPRDMGVCNDTCEPPRASG